MVEKKEQNKVPFNGNRILIEKYFEDKSFLKSSIESFNKFIEVELQRIIEENREVVPTIIPPNIDDYRITFDKVWIEKPQITEADGSKREIYPSEARIRKFSYFAPMFMKVSAHVNGVKKEEYELQIGSLPIMLKSKYCNLYGMSKDELIKHNEDPNDPGGYFIINGSERVVINVEDLAPNKLLISKTKGAATYTGKIFSEQGAYKIPHTIEKLKDMIYYLTFTRVKRIPLVVILKALGMTRDDEIMKNIGLEDSEDVFINLFKFVNVKTQEDAYNLVAKAAGITISKEQGYDRVIELVDRYLFPHLGITEKERELKAINLCKMMKKIVLVSNGKLKIDDKDHYKNKRLKLAGELLADLVRSNFRVLVGDMLYNFQRIVKRGKLPSLKVIIRDKLLTQRIHTSMATGNWIGERKGISQRLSRLNFIDAVSHLQRVVSPLQSTQENFEARALHGTHLGRLCPIETPEGPNIGLRKNLALMAESTEEVDDKELLKELKNIGLKTI